MEYPVGIIEQLGIDWRLLISQAFNFFILLIILRAFAYKPLLNVIKKRNDKIKEGLDKAEVADTKLKEINIIAKDRLKKAEKEALIIISNTEDKAKLLERFLQKKVEDKQKDLMNQIHLIYEKQKKESEKLVMEEAVQLVKRFIVKTVELKPDAIDEALINKATSILKKNEA